MAWRRKSSLVLPPVAPAAVEAERSRELQAAVASVELGSESAWKTWKFGSQQWQAEAWRLYDIVGELRFLAGWIGGSVSRARLYVTKLDELGEPTGEIKDNVIKQIGAAPLGMGDDRDDKLSLLGVNLAVGGESWIIGEGAMTNDPQEWFVVSSRQVKRTGDDIVVPRPLGSGGKKLTLVDGRDLLLRAWKPHPDDIWQPDSPTRVAIPPLREIELCMKREFAELESRLTGAGVWFIPEDLDFPRGEKDPTGMAGFMAMLQRVAATNIREQSNASAMVPIAVPVPRSLVEHIPNFKEPAHFWSDLSEQIPVIKEKAIVRVASSFEIPNEISTGLGSSNHWSAWAISEEGIKRIQPYLSVIAGALTRGFLTPSLERAGIEDAKFYAYQFDVAPLSVRPNRLPEALELWDRGLITDEATVQAGAFGEELIATDEQRLKNLIFQAVASNPSLLTDPGVQAVLGIRIVVPIETTTPVIGEDAEDEDDLENGPPEEQDTAPVDESPPGTTASARSQGIPTRQRNSPFISPEFAACELAVFRALELAGGRLITHADRRKGLSHVPKWDLHIHAKNLSDDRIEKALAGAWEHIPQMCDQLGLVDRTSNIRDILHEYCKTLIGQNLAHSSDYLVAALGGV